LYNNSRILKEFDKPLPNAVKDIDTELQFKYIFQYNLKYSLQRLW